MKATEFRQLIKESIKDYIKEIGEAGDIAAEEAKIQKYQEAIELREKKIQQAESLEEMKDLVDPSKIKNLKSEIKDLQKSLKKTQSKLEKLQNKGKTKDEPEKEMVDESPEVTAEIEIDETFPESGAQLEEESLEEAKKKMTAAQKEKKEDIVKSMKKSKSFGKSKEEKGKMYATATKLAMKESEELNESFLHMQKLASLITETQYKEKMQMLNEDLDSLVKTSILKYFKDTPEDVKKFKDFSSQGGVLSKIINNIRVNLDSSGKITITQDGGKKVGEYSNVIDFLQDIGYQS